ncbi:hypothetical protein BH09PSE5_BH09PSE5_28740 [soil metagenome]
MTTPCDLLIVGTGYFAEIMLNDIATTARQPVSVVVGGRNLERLKWLCVAANSRSALFGTSAVFQYAVMDMGSVDTIAEGLSKWQPTVVVQSASLQSPWSVEGRGSGWSALVNDAGFGLTVAFQAMFPVRTAMALQAIGSDAAFVNTCYPDVVNQVLRARGLPIMCGVGNIAIFSSAIQGTMPPSERADIRVLGAHYHLVEWRKPGAERSGTPVRVWKGETELDGIEDAYRHIQLPYRDLNVISGSAAVPVLLALSGKGDVESHVPGPGGLPGGYPVKVSTKSVQLNLPKAISEPQAIEWCRQFEAFDGASVSSEGRVWYHPQAKAAVAKHDAAIAEGFHVNDLEVAYEALAALRQSLGG